MEADDPFSAITKICHGAFSEDSALQSCSYFGQSGSDVSGFDSGPKNQPDILAASTAIITMASPDNGGDTVSLHVDCSDGMKVVDLGRDTDLVFSEVESTQRFEAISTAEGAFPGEQEENVVPKRGFSPKGQSSTEPLSKKLKGLDFEPPSVHVGSPKDKSADEWPSPGLGLEDQQSHFYSKAEAGGGSVKGKKVDFSTEVIDCDTEERNMESENDNGEGNSGRNKKSIEDVDQFGSNSGGMEGKTEKKRVLPAWLLENVEGKTEKKRVLPAWLLESMEVNKRKLVQVDTDSDSVSEDTEDMTDADLDSVSEVSEERIEASAHLDIVSEVFEEADANEELDSVSEELEEVPLLDVLAALEEDEDCEDEISLEGLSLLEVAQRKWATDLGETQK